MQHRAGSGGTRHKACIDDGDGKGREAKKMEEEEKGIYSGVCRKVKGEFYGTSIVHSRRFRMS